VYRINNQSNIYKDSDWTSQRAKEIYLKLKASEEMHLKKSSWRHVIRSDVIRSKVIRSISHQKHFTRVDKVRCTTINSTHVSATTISATCLHIKTRITTMLLQTLFLWKRNRFEISSFFYFLVIYFMFFFSPFMARMIMSE